MASGDCAGPGHLREHLLRRLIDDGAGVHQAHERGDLRGPDLPVGQRGARGAELAEQVVDDPVAGGLRLAAQARRFLEIVAQSAIGDQNRRQRVRNLVLALESPLLVERQLGAAGPDALPHGVVDLHRHQVRVGKVPVVVRLSFERSDWDSPVWPS